MPETRGRGYYTDDSCCQIFHALSDMTQPSISHHLDILKRNRLVTSEKRGREVYYKYTGAVIIVQCCAPAFRDLDLDVEEK